MFFLNKDRSCFELFSKIRSSKYINRNPSYTINTALDPQTSFELIQNSKSTDKEIIQEKIRF